MSSEVRAGAVKCAMSGQLELSAPMWTGIGNSAGETRSLTSFQSPVEFPCYEIDHCVPFCFGGLTLAVAHMHLNISCGHKWTQTPHWEHLGEDRRIHIAQPSHRAADRHPNISK